MWKQILLAFRLTLVLTIVTGILYPGLVTGVCQLLFHHQANGSLISVNGRVAGSCLIGQSFARREYFQPRPSAAGNDGYDATSSGGSNLGPTSQKLIERVKAAVQNFRSQNPDYTGPVPADLVTASASGLDPHISPGAAMAQAPRIAKARGVSVHEIRRVIEGKIEGRQLGFLGEPRVNVLELNLALDRNYPVGSLPKQTPRRARIQNDGAPGSVPAVGGLDSNRHL
jgi:K+-transporting ATPase ATPase C chain